MGKLEEKDREVDSLYYYILLPSPESIKIERIEDAAKQMTTEEIEKKIDVLEKFKTFKEAREKRDSTYNHFKEAELEFLRTKEAYCVAIKSL